VSSARRAPFTPLGSDRCERIGDIARTVGRAPIRFRYHVSRSWGSERDAVAEHRQILGRARIRRLPPRSHHVHRAPSGRPLVAASPPDPGALVEGGRYGQGDGSHGWVERSYRSAGNSGGSRRPWVARLQEARCRVGVGDFEGRWAVVARRPLQRDFSIVPSLPTSIAPDGQAQFASPNPISG